MTDRLATLVAARAPAGQGRAWTLQDELKFVEGMGTWALTRSPLRSLLTGYLRALDMRRSGLSEMDCIAARQRAMDLLNKIGSDQR